MLPLNTKRLLIVDDNEDIHKDFRKVLDAEKEFNEIDKIKLDIFGNADQNPSHNKKNENYFIDSAFQGEEALGLVKKAILEKEPYALAFVDIRMPPGWDGITTIQKLWEVDPELQIVICSAHSDYSWEEISDRLSGSDNFLILKKPFDIIEIRQLAAALTKKWELNKQVQFQIDNLRDLVNERTADLDKSLSLTQATLEATQEGIIAVSLDNEITSYNNEFLQLWHINADMIKKQTAKELFQQLANQIEDSNLFYSIMTNLTDSVKTQNTREWATKDGRYFELFVRTQYLHNKIIGCVFSFRDISERKNLERQLLHQATHDSLTGLPNRLLLIDRVQQYIAQCRYHKTSLSVLLIDLDNFKQINDSLGHNAGDKLLKTVAQKLQENITEFETVARLGGDEFIIVMQSDIADTTKRTEQLLKSLFQLLRLDDREIVTSASVGISSYPKDGEDPDTLLKNADTALYCAKENGKNSYEFYNIASRERISMRAELTGALRNALDRNEFFINYQPLIELQTNQVIGLEALIRWNHPTLGLLMPQAFISLAEETGLIVPIGLWVLKTACLQAKKWHEQGFAKLQMAVNISVLQIKQHNFVESVKSVLEETHFDPNYLEFEITESMMMGDLTDVLERLHEIKMLGIHLAIDDFGTGYSCLSHVQDFPFEKLKIDKNFMDNVTTNKNNSSIVTAIINMTQNMGMYVLAEGIEKEEQVEFLKQHHNNQVQGYYFSRPLDDIECTKFLEQSLKEKTTQ